jgi:ribonuclease HII
MESLSLLLREKTQPERILHELGYRHVAGVDEAGRGPLAGPVVASAVIFSQDWNHPEIKDSKKLTEKKRGELYHIIRKNALAWSWALVEPDEIDRINILQASLAAMKKAIETLYIKPDYIIVDGPHSFPTHIPQTPIKKGDAKSLAIAAASIMAKVVRDSIMQKHHVLYPQYNFARNKGYGTWEHIRALTVYGYCPIHRKSFKRVVCARES